jgi:hypothetical protein
VHKDINLNQDLASAEDQGHGFAIQQIPPSQANSSGRRTVLPAERT